MWQVKQVESGWQMKVAGKKRMKEAEGKPSTPIFLLSLLSLSMPAT